MREIETEIAIAAAPSRVWDVLLDFPAYPDWNPFIIEIVGGHAPGGQLRVRIRPPGWRAMTLRPIVRGAVREQAFSWRGRLLMPGLFTGEHIFGLLPHGAGTLFRQSERFTGLLVGLLGSGLFDATRKGFDSMNRALKARVEA